MTKFNLGPFTTLSCGAAQMSGSLAPAGLCAGHAAHPSCPHARNPSSSSSSWGWPREQRFSPVQVERQSSPQLFLNSEPNLPCSPRPDSRVHREQRRAPQVSSLVSAGILSSPPRECTSFLSAFLPSVLPLPPFLSFSSLPEAAPHP